MTRAHKVSLGDTRGRNEDWLQDLLFSHPDILPISDIDPSFGPLLPLCRELRTGAGPIDLTFINATGRLTLVECKLWRNPEARRKVVAQVLDYARVLTQWSYSDLQRQVGLATGTRGNTPFELAHAVYPSLVEHQFADAVAQTMRSGRFLLLVAGDGIREDVAALAELINRNTASPFAFGMIEIALYDLGDMGMAVQPRVIAKTHVSERSVVVIRGNDRLMGVGDDADEPVQADDPAHARGSMAPAERERPRHDQYRSWWQPVLEMRFDDPDQDRPRLHFPDNIRAPLPWPGTWITAFASGDRCGVFLSGREMSIKELWKRIEPDLNEIVGNLPGGTAVGASYNASGIGVSTVVPNERFRGDDEQREWLKNTLNAYVNAFRPRLKRLVRERSP